MKLVSMIDYVITMHKNAETNGEYIKKTFNYAKFLKQPLKLGMFVPCDEEGNVLIDPETTMQQGNGFTYYGAEDKDFEEYKEAKKRVIFKGFTYNQETNNIENGNLIIDLDTGSFIHISQLGYGGGYFEKTIEDLVPFELEFKFKSKAL